MFTQITVDDSGYAHPFVRNVKISSTTHDDVVKRITSYFNGWDVSSSTNEKDVDIYGNPYEDTLIFFKKNENKSIRVSIFTTETDPDTLDSVSSNIEAHLKRHN